MAVIWGLDLKEIQWGKFKSSYMFNGVYHLRTTKMIIYQLAMILMVVSESVGTAALSDYVDQQGGIQYRTGFHTQNNDIVAVFSFNIFVGVAVATIFGAAFFFDLFWPERSESKSVHLAWKVCAVIVSFMALADAIGVTIIVATGNAFISGVIHEQNNRLFAENGKPNPIYRKDPKSLVSCVVLWPGMIFTFASTYVLFRSHQHDAKLGPKVEEAGDEHSLENTRGLNGATQEPILNTHHNENHTSTEPNLHTPQAHNNPAIHPDTVV